MKVFGAVGRVTGNSWLDIGGDPDHAAIRWSGASDSALMLTLCALQMLVLLLLLLMSEFLNGIFTTAE